MRVAGQVGQRLLSRPERAKWARPKKSPVAWRETAIYPHDVRPKREIRAEFRTLLALPGGRRLRLGERPRGRTGPSALSPRRTRRRRGSPPPPCWDWLGPAAEHEARPGS